MSNMIQLWVSIPQREYNKICRDCNKYQTFHPLAESLGQRALFYPDAAPAPSVRILVEISKVTYKRGIAGSVGFQVIHAITNHRLKK